MNTVSETNKPPFDWNDALRRHAHDSESAVRRRAWRHGYRVCKTRSPDHLYGPLVLFNDSNAAVCWNLDNWAEAAAALEREIREEQDAIAALEARN
jgi:hypothetical protein